MRYKWNHFYFSEERAVSAFFRPISGFAKGKDLPIAVWKSLLYLLILFIVVISPVFYPLLLSTSLTSPAGKPKIERLHVLAGPVSGVQDVPDRWQQQFMFLKSDLLHQKALCKFSFSESCWHPSYEGGCIALPQNRLRQSPPLGHNFLRVGSGEWISLYRAFSGKPRYLGAVRSFLYHQGNMEQMYLRSA